MARLHRVAARAARARSRLARARPRLPRWPSRARRWKRSSRIACSREAKVARCAAPSSAPADADALLERVYADVPARLHRDGDALAAPRHLLKLRDDGVAAESARATGRCADAAPSGVASVVRERRCALTSALKPTPSAAELVDRRARRSPSRAAPRRRLRRAPAAAPRRARRAIEARRRRRLGDAAELDRAGARRRRADGARDSAKTEHRREAGVRAFEDARTTRRGLRLRRPSAERSRSAGPAGAVVLRRQLVAASMPSRASSSA